MGQNTFGSGPSKHGLLVRAAKILTGRKDLPFIADGGVLVKDGRIAAVGPMQEVSRQQGADRESVLLDLGSRTLLPGLVDAHMHFFGFPSDAEHQLWPPDEATRALRAAFEARKMLRAGITAARCLGSAIGPVLARAIAKGDVPGPRVVAAGQFICSTGGAWDHMDLPLAAMKELDMIADGEDEMRAIVRRRIRAGAQVIKVGLSRGRTGSVNHAWGDSPDDAQPAYTHRELLALVEEAHLSDLRVAAHCVGDQSVAMALDAGVDTIEHGFPLSDALYDRLAENQTPIVTTFSAMRLLLDSTDNVPESLRVVESAKRHFDSQRLSFQRGLETGVRYALGSDLTGYPAWPQDSFAREFEVAVSFGMEPYEAIVAGTSSSAAAIGIGEEAGTLEVGKAADMIACPSDPSVDISALKQVEAVFLDGAYAEGDLVGVPEWARHL